jgi:hypothetical protein
MKAFIVTLALSILLPACAPPAARVQALSAVARRASAEVAGQIRRCYREPRIPSVGRSIVTRLLVRYGSDGMLVGLPVLIAQEGTRPNNLPYAGKMAEAAKLAVIRCSPVRLSPELRERGGSEFYLTFSPGMRA